MNPFCSITSRKSITTVIIFILNISYSYQSCVSLFDSCEYDCDCCGNDINKGIRCEVRNQDLGKRCYESQSVGQSCNISSQCNSQNCVNNICQPLLRSPAANPIAFCPLVGDSSYITAPVNGLLPICACPKGPTQVQDASYAMDDNLSTDYVNYNSHTYSGFIVETTSNAPLRKIVLCTSNANPENDPMCFRLEGKCEHDDNFTLLQEGMIPFVGDLRQSCTTIAVERGRQSYSQYKILFGCRRGGYDDSCQRDSRFHKFRRQIRNRKLDAMCTGDYPVILSEVRLLGKCNEGSPTPPPTSPPSRTPTKLPTNFPTVRTKFNTKIKVRCIHNPCDKDGPRDESDVYVKVYSNGFYIGKTRTASDVKDNRTYCYNHSFYPSNVTIRVGATSWQVRFEVYDYDKRSGDDFMGQYSYTMSSAPRTYSSSSGKSLSSGCGSRTKISFEIKAY